MIDVINARNILSLNMDSFDSVSLKRAYHKMALLYHPDKNGNTIESNEHFRQITEAYQLLQKELESSVNYSVEKESSYSDIIISFVDEIVKGNSFAQLVRDIVLGCQTLSITLFEGMDKDTSLQLYRFLSKYRDSLHITHEILSNVREIILQKYDDMLVYILNPSLEDLLTCKVYKLEIGNDVFLVPLWHSELYFFKTKEIVVLCEPQLPDGVDIDEYGNVYTTVNVYLRDMEIGGVIHVDIINCCIDIDQLLIKREQTIRIKNKGLPIITDNIYDRTVKADIVVKVIIQ